MKAIIDYALNTNDSIVLTLKEEGKDFLMELTINMPNQVEFFGKAQYMPENPYTYDIMICHTAIAGKCSIV